LKVYTLQTVVMGHQGSGVGFSYPIKHFETEELAKRAREEHGALIKEVIESGSIIMVVDGKPKKVMPVAQLLGMLGIGNVAHNVIAGEVSGSVLVVPASGILLPGKN